MFHAQDGTGPNEKANEQSTGVTMVAFLLILFVRAIPKVKDAHVPTR